MDIERLEAAVSEVASSHTHRGCCSNVLLYAGALWGMIREAAKASKEKRAVKPEPYVEREDMNGEKWRQMQKNGMLVPDKFYRA